MKKQKKTGGSARASSAPKKSQLRTAGSRPELRDDGTVVDPHGERWTELCAYVQKLDEHFPTEHVTDRCGFFSTEGEFARYIRELESRIDQKK